MLTGGMKRTSKVSPTQALLGPPITPSVFSSKTQPCPDRRRRPTTQNPNGSAPLWFLGEKKKMFFCNLYGCFFAPQTLENVLFLPKTPKTGEKDGKGREWRGNRGWGGVLGDPPLLF